MRLLVALALCPSSLAALQGGTAFRDASDEAGVLFADGGGSYSLQMGGGTVWFDADGDGDDDLFVAHAGGNNRLYRYTGAGFVDVSAGAGIAASGAFDPLGATSADYDQDGRADIFVMTTGANMLLRNLGSGAFADVAAAAGVAGAEFTSAASWADFDHDGDLDLYVGNYIRTVSFPYHLGEPNQLFINGEGANWPPFVERAAALGVDNTGVFGPSDPAFPQYVSPTGEDTAGCTLSVATLDYDTDGYADIQVGNDFGMWVLPNALYRNTGVPGALGFDDVTHATGFDLRPQYNMGVNPVDFDHDGDWDFYLSNLGDNVFLRNDDGVFVDATYELGPVEGTNPDGTELYSSWATIWADFDNDTFEDLFIVNGFIPAAPFITNSLREVNALWQNVGGGEFLRIADDLGGVDDDGPGRGAGWTDVNGDGRIDLYTTNNREIAAGLPADASRLWINQIPGGNRWAEFRLRGRFSNREGIGARLEASIGGDTLQRAVLADTVYLSGSTKLVHFGLGAAQRIDRLTIHWPSGCVQDLLRLPANARSEVLEAALTADSIASPAIDAGLMTIDVQLFNHASVMVAGKLTFFLEHAGSGALVPLAQSSQTLAPGSHTVRLTATIPAGTGLGPGATLNLLLRVTALGGTDDEAVTFVIP